MKIPLILVMIVGAWSTSVVFGETVAGQGNVDLAEKEYEFDGSTAEMNAQMLEAMRELKQECERLSAVLLDLLDEEEEKVFRDEQKAWDTFSQAHVSLSAFNFRGGTITSIIAGSTQIRLRQERIRMLRILIDYYAPR